MSRVYDIMKRDGNKDPDVFPNALLAMVLIDQVDSMLKFHFCASC